MTQMRRREFIALGAAGVAMVCSPAARGQNQPVIGLLSTRSADDSKAVLAAFHRGLGEMGYLESRNALIEYCWAAGNMHELPALADDLVKRRVAVIASVGGEPAAFAAKRSTSSIPIIFIGGSDPARTGIVDSINRPSGNITGVTLHSNALEPKKLQLLRELVPTATTIAVLLNPQTQTFPLVRADVEEAANSVGQKIHLLLASSEQEIERAFATLAQLKIEALVVGSNPFFSAKRHQIIALAARHAVPAIYDSRIQVADGGLLSYGTSYTETYRQAGIYVGRVLRGIKPSELPVLFPTKFELVLNLKTAKALGLDMPPTMLARADEVIE